MPSTSDYINQLKIDKENLVSNLISKGVQASDEETFTSLVPKVLEIQGGDSEYNASFDTETNVGAGYSSSAIKKLLSKCPTFNTSNWMYMNELFKECTNLKEAPFLDTSSAKHFNYMFDNCRKLETIPLYDTSEGTHFEYMFQNCHLLKTIPQLNLENATNMLKMFMECQSLTDIPSLNTPKAKDIRQIFVGCTSLKNVGLIEAGSVTSMLSPFYRSKVENFEGFKDLGKAYTSKSANYSSYTLSVDSVNTLTHDSLINIINNLYDLNLTYDVANGGTLYTQKLVLGSTNLAKLTADEIAIATNKGWSVS